MGFGKLHTEVSQTVPYTRHKRSETVPAPPTILLFISSELTLKMKLRRSKTAEAGTECSGFQQTKRLRCLCFQMALLPLQVVHQHLMEVRYVNGFGHEVLGDAVGDIEVEGAG